MRVEQEYKKTGYFWLPESEEDKIPGVLTISDGGRIELEIVGHFNEAIQASTDNTEISRIIGHVEGDGLVTLNDCFYTVKNIAFGGISKSKILVQQVLSGAAWEKDEAVTFNTLSFSVDCLDEWVGLSGIKVDRDWNNKTATISYSAPENISLMLNNGLKLKICFAYTLPGAPKVTEAKITQRAYFRLESDRLIDLSEFTTLVFKITNLMCFATNEIVTIKNLVATSREIQFEPITGKQSPVPISIYYQSIPFAEKTPKKNWHEMLFNFKTIADVAEEVFNKWLDAYEDLSPALNLYFSTQAGAQKYLDGKFLALAQGLETYHRRTSTETLMKPETFDSLVEEIIKGCPENHVEWLKGRLAHGNEINLGKRLKKIIEPFKQHLGSSSDRSKFLRKIVDTRNYLTHYSEDLKDKTAKGREMWAICQKMEVIFNLHFLKVIGFNEDKIDSVVENSHLLKRKLQEI
ncbi:HEPN domain-containing protein [Pseudomonas sp. NPDC078863]|uniref:ApeA N-terminal domain 1-containing protein n=1 Tax=Pseudomonas sp. NPDC078863 TaxID=3364425 RepID=UPI0037C9CC2E